MTGIEEIALYAALASAAVGAVATVSAAQSQADAQDYNAKVAENNATTVNAQGNIKEDQMRVHARQVQGMQLASIAQSGTQLNGTNLDLVKTSQLNEELDANNIRYDTEVKASGLNTQAGLDRVQADNTRTGGYLSAAGKLIGASGSYLNGGGTVPSYGTGIGAADGSSFNPNY